ncbi:MAG: hypothetical protein ACRDO7_16050 [Nocardioidaceae bacterium]
MRGKRTTLRTVAVTVLVTPALLLGPAADADSIKKKDPKGDAPHAIDVTGFKANNGKRRIMFQIKGRFDLMKLQSLAGIARPKGKSKPTFYLMIFRHKRSEPGSLYFAKNNTYKRCRGMDSLHAKGDWIRFYAPQRCFGKHAGTMRFSFGTTSFKGKKVDTRRFTKPVGRG